MSTLANLPQNQISQLISFGEKEFAKAEDNSLKLKAVKLENKIKELIDLYTALVDQTTNDLKAADITISEFQLTLIGYLRDLYSWIIIETKAPVSQYIDEMNYQIAYVLRYGLDIQNGRGIALDDERVNYRTSLYIFSAWVFYQNVERYWSKATNKTLERIVCENGGCGTETDWEPIGTTKRINEKQIGQKCWCKFEFK